MHLKGAGGGSEDIVNIGGLFRLLRSRPTASLHVLRGLQEWMQGRELSGLWATSGRLPQSWVPVEEVGKTSTHVRKAALALAAVRAEESPPPAPPARLKLELKEEEEGLVCRGRFCPRTGP